MGKDKSETAAVKADPGEEEAKGKSNSEFTDRTEGRHPADRQAVVIIHGIGEQIPMATLRGFVDAVWVTDENLICKEKPDGDTGENPRNRNPIWTKPDYRNRSFELRRITTERDVNQVRTDFYEYYWAHKMHGTTIEQVYAWIVTLLWRPCRKVPDDVRPVWYFSWALIIFFIMLLLAIAVSDYLKLDWIARIGAFTGSAAVLIIIGIIIKILKGNMACVAGDIARYVQAKPLNVARRQEIREDGVELLETLMGINPESLARNRSLIKNGEKPVWDTDYKRIIVVGHSLGSIIGYDLLKYAFARSHMLGLGRKNDQPERRKLEEYCRDALNRAGGFDLQTFRRMQRSAFIEMRDEGSPWIVSDFVTLGAALTHAEFLMAEDEADMHRQQFERILPTCPPTIEWDRHTDLDHFSFRVPDEKIGDNDEAAREGKKANPDHFRYPHHAAHFAFTRWTNIHSPSYCLFRGDLVSGPVGAHYGLRERRKECGINAVEGAEDIAVLDHWDSEKKHNKKFTHLDYWRSPQLKPGENGREFIPEEKIQHHIASLRKALDLLFDRDETIEDRSCKDEYCVCKSSRGASGR